MSENKKSIFVKHPTDNDVNWDEWLISIDTEFKAFGYRKYNQNNKGEDCTYWKTFYSGEDKLYQAGVRLYDYRKYGHSDPAANRIGHEYECHVLGGDGVINLVVGKNIHLHEFEQMAHDFYVALQKYI